MPLYSDHNYYYGTSQPPPYYIPSSPYTPATSRISSPHSYSYMSPISAMLSASIGSNPLPRGLRSYTPLLSSISESSSPVVPRRDISSHRSSPRHLAAKTYYRQPRPVVIDTENIDVSRRKKNDNVNDEESTPGLISRSKTIVRMHTKQRKENPDLKKKKSQAELLMEKYLIKEKPIKEEETPRRKRIWEEREEELKNTPARSGTIKRSNTVHKKMTSQLPLPETDVQDQTEDTVHQRKMSVDSDLLREEAAIFDSMIQEELGLNNKKEIIDENKNTKTLTEHSSETTKPKTKRDIMPYVRKKSSRNLTLDESVVPTGKRKSHVHKKRSSKNLPLDDLMPSESLTNINVMQDESKINKRRSTKKKKSSSGPLKFKIDSLHVEEKSSPKLLRKFKYEVIVEEVNVGNKIPPQQSETHLNELVEENIPKVLKQEMIVDQSTTTRSDSLNDISYSDMANITLGNVCDNACDIITDSVNIPEIGVSTEDQSSKRSESVEDNVLSNVTSKADNEKENFYSKKTENYMNKFVINGSLEKQLNKESDSCDKKNSIVLDNIKKQKTDSLKPEDFKSEHSKMSPTTSRAGEVKIQEKPSGLKSTSKSQLNIVENKTDHSILPNTTAEHLGDKDKLDICNEKCLDIRNKEHSYKTTLSSTTNDGFSHLKEQSHNINDYSVSSKESSAEKSRQLMGEVSQEVTTSSLLQNTESLEFGGKVFKNSTPKSGPNTPVLSKKKILGFSTNKTNVDQKDSWTEVSNKSVSPKFGRKILTNVKSDPSTLVLSKNSTEQLLSGTSEAQDHLTNEELTRETLELGKTALKNMSSKSEPNTPVLPKKEISSVQGSNFVQNDSITGPFIKSGTPEFSRKIMSSVTPKSEPTTPVFLKKEIPQLSAIKCNISSDKAVIEKTTQIKSPKPDEKILTHTTLKSKPTTPVLSKKAMAEMSTSFPNSPQNESKKANKTGKPDYDRKIIKLTSKSGPTTPVLSKKEINQSSVSKINIVQKDSVTAQSNKCTTPEFNRKVLVNSKPKSEPSTPVLPKKDITQLDSNTYIEIKTSLMEQSDKSGTPESTRKLLTNEPSKSEPSTPVSPKKEVTQIPEVQTDSMIEQSDKERSMSYTKESVLSSSNKMQKPIDFSDLKKVKPLIKKDNAVTNLVKPQIYQSEIESSVQRNEDSQQKIDLTLQLNVKTKTKDKLDKIKSDVHSSKSEITVENEATNNINTLETLMATTQTEVIDQVGEPLTEKPIIKEKETDKQTKLKVKDKFLPANKNVNRNILSNELVAEKGMKIDTLSRSKENPSPTTESNINIISIIASNQSSTKEGKPNQDLVKIKTTQLIKADDNINLSLDSKTAITNNSGGFIVNEKPFRIKVDVTKTPLDKEQGVIESINIKTERLAFKGDQTIMDPKKDKATVTKIEDDKQELNTDLKTKQDRNNKQTNECLPKGKPGLVKPGDSEPLVDQKEQKIVMSENKDIKSSLAKQTMSKLKTDLPIQAKPPEDMLNSALPQDVTKNPAVDEIKDKTVDKMTQQTGNFGTKSKLNPLHANLEQPLDSSGKEKISDEVKDITEKKKRIKSESDIVDDFENSSDKTCSSIVPEGQDIKISEKSKSLNEKISEKSPKKKKKSKEKDKQKETADKTESTAAKQSKVVTTTTTTASSEVTKTNTRLIHFINKCMKLSADNDSIFVEMSDEDESSSSEYTSDSEYTSNSEGDSMTDDDDSSSECDVNCHRKCEKLMPNLCGVNQKLIVEALSSLRKGSSESRDHGSPTRRQSNAALSLDEVKTEPARHHPGRVTPPATTIPKFRKYTMDDFQFLKVLGKGSFGKVLLAELRGTQYYYAVKCLKKDVVLEDDDVECTLIERKVLALGTNHPYLCHLFCTFQTDSHLFFVMEYLNGGDLMFHIQQQGRFDEGRARFYAAEIVSGLKFLHKKGIVYRDLKLDNILLDFDGHVRIADFGMCKLQIYLDRTADTFCGTPDYMAPEIIKGLKYNQCVDWWSFGILMYEMLVGQSPFSGCDEDDLFWCICNRQPHYPRFITLEAKRILMQLLEKEAIKRLGSSENGAAEVMAHPFFNGLDWDRLEHRELQPPFKPNVKHPLDVHYFDKHFTAERACLTPIDPSILQSMDQTQFQGFSYTNPNVTD